MSQFIKFFDELSIKDVPSVGGKNASLGEMYCNLKKEGVLVPNGFATTSEAYNFFLEEAKIKKKIRKTLKGLNSHSIKDLYKKGKKVREIILKSKIPPELEKEIYKAYKKLSRESGVANLDVAVRSSATAEDLPDASFAGQQETYLNIKGEKQLLTAIKKCIASLFTNRAISYREDKGFDHFNISLSVGVQKMIRSDKASSGVMFSLDTESGFENVVLINSIYGLGENIVQGKVNPDEFWVFKPTKAIISRSIGNKGIKMVYNNDSANPVKDIKVSPKDQKKPSITDKQIIQLAKWAIKIEKHYNKPMDMEWALDGRENQLYIIQARPETVNSMRDQNVIKRYRLQKTGDIITTGQSVGDRIGSGVANRIMNLKDIKTFKKGEVLVTDMTDPDWEPIMKIASAIVTDKGGRTCHAAIVSRELGIPCVVGTQNVSQKVKKKEKITVDASQGETGYIYKGELPFKIIKESIKNLKKPKTKMMMNVGSPDLAFPASFVPNDGIGLARLEFIINNHIKVHPLALLDYKKLKDKKLKKEIDEITKDYKDKKEFFIEKLSEGVATIAASVYPKDCIVRLSDFKSNEYANLLGGRGYEPVESNPMIGWRGASRYYSPKFLPAFEMECAALKKVREELGLNNLKIMIPFCRTVEEGKKVKEIMAKNGLKQGKNNLEIYVMAEIPTNIIVAEQFAKEFDGFSIGSNDLTQLTLGIDRDAGNALKIEGVSNEKNESVKALIEELIRVARKTKTKVGICGQAPSDFPDFNEFLVECGIDSISLIPETVIKTTQIVNKAEAKLKNKK
ncbi:phosphoenolpyruvate synthase, partial [bacterium]|nr:phosphoenolpyruvate synthase [bacterium]